MQPVQLREPSVAQLNTLLERDLYGARVDLKPAPKAEAAGRECCQGLRTL